MEKMWWGNVVMRLWGNESTYKCLIGFNKVLLTLKI